MKKHLLLGTALFAAVSAFPQQAIQKQQATAADRASILAEKFARANNPYEPAAQAETKVNNTTDPVYGPEMNPSATSRAAITIAPAWKKISASSNIYGMLVNNTKPLMYNDELNAVSLVHRKYQGFATRPPLSSNAQSGGILAVISDNWGEDWDTTLLWNSENYWGRYPQGGTYAIPGAHCLRDSAYILATGPVTGSGQFWQGSFLASKKLDTLGGAGNNDTVSTGFSDHVFLDNSGSFGPAGKTDFPRYDFTVTDDGVVRSMGYLVNDINGTGSSYGWQGASYLKATFAGGSFNWTGDTIKPDVFVNSLGSQNVSGVPHMCWNESGTVGYVWFIGVRNPRPGQGDTLANMGYQPIIFKSTNSGATWTEMPRINFNSNNTQFDKVFRQIYAVRGGTLGIPFFNTGEGVDGIVDRNNRLHIVSTVVGAYSKHPDSLGYTYLLTHADGERYNFGHEPGLRPYIFDFTETNTGNWNVTMIDSMSSESPGETTGTDGYQSNPWDAAGGTSGTDKVGADARIQLSRTPNGRYIVYTWAESDTAFTSSGFKWNQRPNVKARMAEVGVESGSSVPATLVVHPTEINVTNPTATTQAPYTKHSQVQNRAVMHYISSKCAVISNTASSGVSIGLPITVSNNTFVPLHQLDEVNHWYLSANLNFDNVNVNWPTNVCVAPKQPTIVTSMAEMASSIEASMLYPNPAANVAQLSIGLKNGSNVEVSVMNTMGQVVRTVRHTGRAGENTISIDLSNIATGVYMVNIKVDDTMGTKKLIIQQ